MTPAVWGVARWKTLPEWGSFVEQVSYDGERDQGENNSDQGPGNNIHGVVEVVADSGKTDPEWEDDHGKLDERSQNLQDSVAESDWCSLDVGHLVQPSLEVDDQEGSTVEAEAGVSGQEWETSFVEFFLILFIILTHGLLILHHKFVISIIIFASFFSEVWVTQCQVMRSQATNLIFCELCEQQGCQSSQSEVTKVSVELKDRININ